VDETAQKMLNNDKEVGKLLVLITHHQAEVADVGH
jgi:hypothetical protein